MDSIEFVRELEHSGFKREQAEAQVKAMANYTKNLSTKEDVCRVEFTLKQDIVRVESTLKQDIERVESTLTKKIEVVEARLTKKIEMVEARLTKLEATLRQEIADVEARLRKEIADVEARLRQEIADFRLSVKKDLDAAIQLLEEKMFKKEDVWKLIAGIVGLQSIIIAVIAFILSLIITKT